MRSLNVNKVLRFFPPFNCFVFIAKPLRITVSRNEQVLYSHFKKKSEKKEFRNISLLLQNDEVKTPPTSIKKSPRKMWVEVMGTGDLVEIDVDKNKPSFDSKEEEVKWEKQSANDAMKFKKKVESGQHIPAEVLTRIKSKSEKTPQEEEILRKEKEMSNHREKVSIQKLLDFLTFLTFARAYSLKFSNFFLSLPRNVSCLWNIECWKRTWL